MGRNSKYRKRKQARQKGYAGNAVVLRLNPVTAMIRASLPAGLLLGMSSTSFAEVLPDFQSSNSTIGRDASLNHATIDSPTARGIGTASTIAINVDQSVTINQAQTAHYLLNSSSTGLLPEQILGRLNSAGSVTLYSANGILIGPSAAINVNSLIATGLKPDENAFANGQHLFFNPDGSEGGMVVNQGLLSAATGGSVTLIGGAVRNEGTILATAGQVNLVAGKKVTMDFDGDGLIQFTVNEAILDNVHDLDDAISNTGTIRADGGSVLLQGKTAQDVFTNVVNNSGVIGANKIQNQGGQIKLVATGTGNSLLNTGIVDASSTDSDGGNIEIHAEDKTIIAADALITAASETGNGGKVQITGDKVGLIGNTSIDASGDTGGGEVLIGGDLQGKNPDVHNAQLTYVGNDVSIKADAVTEGNGGKVILWSDDTTHFYGDISARGGGLLGDGGFVEISGKETLYADLVGTVDTSAANGETGTLLIDPTDIEILDGTNDSNDDDDALTTSFQDAQSGNIAGTILSTDTAATSDPYTLYESELEGIAATTNIVLQATNNITIADLTDNNLNLAQTGGNSVTFTADADGNNTGNFIMTGAATDTITTAGGAITISGDGVTVGAITSGGGNITLNADSTADGVGGVLSIQGAINSGGGDINLLGENFTIAAGINSGAGNIFLTEPQVSGPLTFGDEFDQAEVDLLTSTGTITFGRATDATSTVTTMQSTTFQDAVGINFTTGGASDNIVIAATNTIDFSEGGDATGSTVTVTNLTLDTTGGATVTQGTVTPDSIVASTLSFVGDGIITLNSTANDVDSISASGTTAVTFTDLDGVDFSAANFVAASLNLTTGAAITDTGTLTISGVTTLNANAGAAAITLNSAGNDFDSDDTGDEVNAAGTNITLVDTDAIVLGDIDDGGIFDLTAGGAVSQTAAAGAGNNIDVTGTSSFTATGNAVTLTASNNDFGGAVSAVGTNISLTDTNAIQLDDIDDGGNFVLTSGGAVTQTAAGVAGDNVDVTGTTSITATGFAVTLNEATNDFGGAVSAAGTNISLTDVGAIQLDDIDDGGNLVVIASAGAITQTAAAGAGNNIDVTGTSSFTATGNAVTLTASNNDFGGAVSAVGTNISLTDTNAIQLDDIDDGGNFVLTSGGAVTQTAAGVAGDNVDVTGTTSITATGFAVTLNEATNDFGGAVSAAGTNISLTDVGAIQLDDIDDGGNLVVIASAGAITQTAAAGAGNNIDVTGTSSFTATGNAVTLTASNNDFGGAVSAVGTNISLTDTNAIQLDDIDDGGNFVLTSGGAVTQTAAGVAGDNVDVTGTTSITATGFAVTLNEATNDFGGAVSAAGTNISLTDVGAIQLDDIDDGGNLVVIASAGAITQTAAAGAGNNIDVTGTSSFTATGNAVTLTSNDNDFTLAVSAAGTNVSLTDTSSLVLGTINDAGALNVIVDATDDGSDTLTFNGDVNANSISASGTSNNESVILGLNADITATTGNIVLGAAQNFTGIDLNGAGTNVITATAGAIDLATVTDSAAVNELELNAGTDITLAGVTLNGGGTAILDIDLDEGADGIETLDLNGDISVGSLTVDGQTANDTVLIGANVDITASTGDIAMGATQNISAVTLDGAGSNTITATAGAIDLAALTDTANITILNLRADTGVTLDTVTLNNAPGSSILDIRFDQGANDVAALNVTNALTVGTLGLVLGQGTNDTMTFGGLITTSSGGVSLSDAATININGGINAASNIDINAVTTVNAAAGGNSITGTEIEIRDNNNVGTFNITGTGLLTIDASSPGTIALADITDTANADLTINAGAGITAISSVNMDGGGTLTVDVGTNAATGAIANFVGTVTAGVIDFSGFEGNDTFNIQSALTATAGAVTIDTANTVDVADISAETDITIDVSTGVSTPNIDLNGTSYLSNDGNITITGSIDLDATGAVTFDSDADNDAADGNINLNGAVTDNAIGDSDLIVDADTADVGLNAIGTTTRIGTLTVTGNDISFAGDVESETITVTAQQGVDDDSITINAVTLDANDNNIVLSADDIAINAAANLISTGASATTITFIGETAATTIGLGDSAAGTLNLTQAELNTTDSTIEEIIIGFDTTQSGTIQVNNTGGLSIGDSALRLRVETAPGDIDIDSNLTLTNSGSNLTIEGVGDTTLLSGDITTNGGDIIINDSVLVDGARTLDSSNGGAAATAGLIQITGPIGSLDTSGDTLTLTADSTAGTDGNIDVISDIGNVLTNVNGVAANDLNAFTATGAQIDVANIEVTSGNITITGSNIDLNGTTYLTTTSGAVSFTGVVDLTQTGGTTTVQTAGGAGDNITFSSTINDDSAGDTALTLNAGASGNVSAGNIGGSVSPGTVDIDGAQIDVGDISVEAADILVTGSNIDLNGAGYTANTSGQIVFTGPVDLDGTGISVSTAGGAGDDITFTSTIDDDTAGEDVVQINAGAAGDVIIGGALGGTTRTATVDIDGLEISVDSIRVDGTGSAANIFVGTIGTTTTLNLNGANYDSINSPTSGIIRFDGPVTLNQTGGTTTVASTSGANSDITFRGTVDDDAIGDTALIVNTGTVGDISFQQAIGGGTEIESLTITNANQLDVVNVTTTGAQSYTATNIDLNGAAYESNVAGTIGFTGPVDLFNNVTVTSAGGGGDDISFSSTINADDATTNDRSLTLDGGAAGNVTISGAAGGTEALDGGVTISGATINTNAITTDGTDAGANQAAAAVTITGTGSVSVGGAINAIGKGTGNGGAVDIDAGGANPLSVQAITANSAAGGLGGIIKLNDDGGTGTITLNDNLTSTGTITGGTITLGTATILATNIAMTTGASPGNIIFDSTLDSEATENNSLDLTAGLGSITFSAAVGSGVNQELGAITINSVNNVTALNTIEAASFTQIAGTGTTTFSNAVDANAGDINVTTDAILVNGTLTTSAAGTTGTIQISNNVTVNAALDAAADDIILNGGTTGTLTISALISDDSPISLTATDDIIITGTGTVQTTGANDITLTADTGPADGAGGIWIQTGGLVDSGQNVVLNGSDIIAAATADAGIDIQSNGGTALVNAVGTVALNHNAATADTTDMVINGLITSGNSVTVSSRNDIIMGVDGDITSTTGGVTLTADTSTGALGGVVDMADGTIVNAGNALIDIDADGNIDLGLVTTTNATAGAVNLNSDNGAITDADGAGGADVTASTGGLIITAEQGVAAIETEVARLNVTNNVGTPAGNIVINEADDVLLDTNFFNAATNGTIALTTTDGSIDTGTVAVSTQDGGITFTAGDTGSDNGSINVGAGGIASSGAGAGNIILNATDGIALGGDVNALADTVTINADTGDVDNAGAISRTTGTVSGSSIDLDAATGIVAVTATDTLAVDNDTSGNVDIDNDFATAVTVSSLTTAGTTEDITFDQTGLADVTFTSINSPDAVTLNSEAGITLNDVTSDDLTVNIDTDDATVNSVNALLDLGNGILTVTNTIVLSGGTTTIDDVLRGNASGHTWVITGANAGLIDTGAPDFASFSSFATISGDNAVVADTIDQSDAAASAGPISVVLVSAGTDDGMAGTVTGLIDFDNIDSVIGTGAGDSLTGFNTTATWTLDGGTENYLDTISGQDIDFNSDFTTLTGGAGDDTFDIQTTYTGDLFGDPAGLGNDGTDSFIFDDLANPIGTARLVGNINGGAFDGAGGAVATQIDTIDFSSSGLTQLLVVNVPGTDNGQTGTIRDVAFPGGTSLISGTFDNINSLTGNNLGTITGPDAATWWNVTALDTGFFGNSLANSTPASGTGFSGFNIIGGSDNDTFIFQNGGQLSVGINGGAGTNTLVGSTGADTFDITGATSVDITVGINTTTLTNINNIDGTDAYTGNNAGVETDTGADIFNITNSWSGSFNGAEGNDSFNFTDGVTVGGSIAGGVGTDVLNWQAYTTARTVALTGSATDGFTGTEATITGGFNSINDLQGSDSGIGQVDSISGINAVVADWDINGDGATVNQYTDNTTAGGPYTLDFSYFEDVTGGNGADTINVLGAFTGDLSGGDGADILNVNANVTGTLTGAGDNDQINYVAGIVTTLLGGTGTDTIVGENDANAWTTTGTDAGTLDGQAFSQVENWTGGTAVDTFTLNHNVTGTVTGADGDDIFNYNAGTIGILRGGNNDDTIIGENDANAWVSTGADAGTLDGQAFSEIENWTGGTAVDTMTLGHDVTGTVTGGDGDDLVTYTAGTIGTLTGGNNNDTIFGENDANTWVSTGPDAGTLDGQAFASFENWTGGTAVDTMTLSHAVTGTVTGANGNDLITYNDAGAVGTLTGGAGTDTIFAQDTLHTWASTANNAGTLDGRAFDSFENWTGAATADDTFNMGHSVSGRLDGQGGGNDSANFSAGQTVTMLGTGNGILNIENVDMGGGGTLVGSAGTTDWTLNAASGGTANDGTTTVTFTNAPTIRAGTGTDTFTSTGAYNGTINLTSLDNTWIYTPGANLTNGSVTGGGALTVLAAAFPAISPTIDIAAGDLVLPDLTGFTGQTIIGGTLTPPGTTPFYEATAISFNTTLLTVTDPIVSGGPVTLLGGDLVLNNDITIGSGTIGLVAAGPAAVPGSTGIIDASAGDVTLTAPAGTEPSGAFVANDNIVGSDNITLDFGGGEVDVATGAGDDIEFNGASVSSDVITDPQFEAFVNGALAAAGVNVGIITTFSINPASALIGLETLAFIDLGLFEEELQLFGTIGTGIALALAQCEEQEGCAPNVTEDELKTLISSLEARIEELRQRQQEDENAVARVELDELIEAFNKELQSFNTYLAELQAFFSAEAAAEEALEDEFIEDDPFLDSQQDEITILAGVLETIKGRIDWLEGLKEDPEERNRLSEATGIELTLEELDKLIEAARAEAAFIENRIRLLLEGTEAGINAPGTFTAEARDYSDTMVLHYGPDLLRLNNTALAGNGITVN